MPLDRISVEGVYAAIPVADPECSYRRSDFRLA